MIVKLSEAIRKALYRSADPVAAVQLMDFATEEEAREAAELAVDLQTSRELAKELGRDTKERL